MTWEELRTGITVRTEVIDAWQSEVEAHNRDKGFYDEERTFGDEIALIHSEVSEMLEAFRIRGAEEYTDPNGKPDDLGSEAADTFIRLMDLCRRYGIDLVREYDRKMAYNRTRPYRHGKRM